MVEAIDREARHPSFLARYWTHDQSLPECFNTLTAHALQLPGATHVWFVEEDVVVPRGALDALLGLKSDIAAVNYLIRTTEPRPISSYWATAEGILDGRERKMLLWVSLGCTLVHARVFEKLEYPWFRTDLAVVGVYGGSASKSWKLDVIKRDPKQYGGQDSTFCYMALKAGFTIGEVPWQELHAEHLDRLVPACG